MSKPTTIRRRRPISMLVTAVDAPHGVNPDIMVTFYPNGLITMREKRRRTTYETTLGAVYVGAIRKVVASKKKHVRRTNRTTRAR